jgi:hypothetical protein
MDKASGLPAAIADCRKLPRPRKMATAAKLATIQQTESRMFERHFSLAELAELWNLSVDTIRCACEHESGVLIFENPSRNPNRRRRTIRIPQSVAERVYRKLCT